MTNSTWLQILPESLRRRLDGKYLLQAVAANTGWLIADKLTRILAALIVGAWVARYLGPMQFGELSYALALAAFFQAVANLGLDGIVVRDIARTPEKSPEILGTALRLRLCSGLLAWLGSVITVMVLRPNDIQSLILVALVASSTVFQSADTVDLWFQSNSQSRRTVKAKLIAMLISNGARVSLILFHAPLDAFAAVQFIELAFGALALGWAYRKYPTSENWRSTLSMSKGLLHESWPLLLGGISVMVYMKINQIMLCEMVGGRELGVFSAVVPFAEVWNFIPVTICTSIAPLIALKKLEGEIEYYKALQNLFSGLAWTASLIAIVVAIASPMIVSVMLGPKYSDSAPVLAVLAIAAVPTFLGVAQVVWIINEGNGRLALMKSASGAIASGLSNYFLIPRYGAMGAAIATVISQLISAVFSNILIAPNIFKMQIKFLRIGNHG